MKKILLTLTALVIAIATQAQQTEDMYIYLRSYLPEKEKAATGTLSVDWIRVYAK